MFRGYPFRITGSTLGAVVAASLASTANAGPITGSGIPVPTSQPSLAVTWLVRTQDPTNAADLGQVVGFAGNYAPGGFAVANGQTLPISANPVLFNQIGATYGGDGRTTFDLPNLAGREVVGTGSGFGLTPRALGSTAGAPVQTLTTAELPPFGGATGFAAGSQRLTTLQPSLALNQAVVMTGAYPLSTGAQAQVPLLGQVLTYAGTMPAGVTPAIGQQLPINQQQALFSIVGATYGGNGQATFALPDLAGRAATEPGNAPGLTPETLGEIAGSESTLISLANLPPQPLRLANGSTAILGGGVPFSVRQPTLGLHDIVAVQGMFPQAGTIVPDGVPFLGEISLFAGTVAPAGWAFADGQLLSIAQNSALFAVIGDTFGGNGIATFALPNLMDRVAVGTGDGFNIGEMFGLDNDSLTFAQLPVGYPAALSASVPEPASIAVLLSGLAALLTGRRRRGGRYAAAVSKT